MCKSSDGRDELDSWGSTKYEGCQPSFSSFRDACENYVSYTGGLGRRMIPDKFEVWICYEGDLCLETTSADPLFCYVFDEELTQFVAWGPNTVVRLVRRGP